MARTRTGKATLTLDEERVALRIQLHVLREGGGDTNEIAAGESRRRELNRLIAAQIAGKT